MATLYDNENDNNIRRANSNVGWNPDIEGTENGPLGDMLLPLLIISGAYILLRRYRLNLKK